MKGAEVAGRVGPRAFAELYDFFFCDEDESRETADSQAARDKDSSAEGVEGWDDWGLKEGGDAEGREWLRGCLISTVPSLDVVALANGTRFALLEASGTGGSGRELVVGEKVETGLGLLDILCLPMAVSKRSETRGQDWVSLAVATDTGEVIFYSDRGKELVREKFSAEPALSMDFGRVVHGSQELSVLFLDVLVTIDGLSLYAALRTARSQAVRGHVRTETVELVYKKWSLEESGEVSAHVCLGPLRPTAFHQLERASMTEGIRAWLPSSLPNSTSFLTVGKGPFLGFYHIEDAATHAGLKDAVLNLADKVSASASSYLGYLWGGSEEKGQGVPALEVRPIRVQPRNVFPDAERDGECAYPAPFGDLVAVTDTQARVTLIKTSTREVVRMWKGYRNAECGWVTKWGEVGQRREGEGDARTRALFLVIFTSKRGLLEIWTAENGPRVAAFNVHKLSRLVQGGRRGGHLGAGSESSGSEQPLWLLSPSGHFHLITLPFHAALQDDSSAHIHDTHLLKELRAAFESSKADVTGILRKLRTVTALKSAADALLHPSNASFCPKSASLLLEDILKLVEAKEENSTEAQVLKATLNVHLQLVHSFALVHALHAQNPSPVPVVSPNPGHDRFLVRMIIEGETGDVGKLLKCSEGELESLMEVVGEAAALPSPLPPLPDLDFHQFSASLTHYFASTDPDSWSITLAEGLEPERIGALGKFLFAPLLREVLSLDAVRQSVTVPLRLSQDDCLRLIIVYWLSERKPFPLYPPTLLSTIAGFGVSERTLGLCEEELLRSRLLPEAYTLGIVVRGLRGEVLEEELEALDVAEEKWDLVVGHLELLTRLQLLALRLPAPTDLIRLQHLLTKGRSFYREQMARMLAAQCLSPSVLSAPGRFLGKAGEDLAKLRALLPQSLDSEALAAETAWEAGSGWFREPGNVRLLQHCVLYLEELREPILQHGLSLMLWDTFVRKPFRHLYLLLDKVKKQPKERLCRKEVGVGEEDVETFARCVAGVLKVHLAGNAAFETSTGWDDQFEPLIHRFFALADYKESGGASRDSLLSLTEGQKCTYYQLVELHWEVAAAIVLMLHLRYRPAQPSLLLDHKGREALFAPLHSHPLLPLADVDAATKGERAKFLTTCTRLDTVMALEEPTRHLPDSKPLIWELARHWEIHADLIRREEGEDDEAFQLLEMIESRGSVGADLLLLLGQKVAGLVEERRKDSAMASALSSLSPRVLDWLRSLPAPALPPPPTPVPRLLTLHSHVLALLSAAHAEAALATALLQVIQALQ